MHVVVVAPLPLPPPAAELGASGIIAGKSCCVLPKRVLTVAAWGQPLWASVEDYAVLFTIAGPPPSRCALQ